MLHWEYNVSFLDILAMILLQQIELKLLWKHFFPFLFKQSTGMIIICLFVQNSGKSNNENNVKQDNTHTMVTPIFLINFKIKHSVAIKTELTMYCALVMIIIVQASVPPRQFKFIVWISLMKASIPNLPHLLNTSFVVVAYKIKL